MTKKALPEERNMHQDGLKGDIENLEQQKLLEEKQARDK